MTTGVVTLILEANPYLTAAQVKQIIIETARTDNRTGIIPVDGSFTWGWGKLNAYAAVKLALITQGLSVNEVAKSVDLSVFPNPTNEKVFIFHSVASEIQQIELITVDGKRSIVNQEVDGSINVSSLKSGMYFLRLIIDGKSVQLSFIKE
jgi:hypothetical protein